MSIHDDVYEQLSKNGPMGVNALSKALNIPLSTMQKYLDKDQSYFKKNYQRKWELPEESIRTDMSTVSNNIANVIDSQLMSMQALIDTLMSQFRATVTLIETNKPSNAPVAVNSGNSMKIDPRLLTLVEDAAKLTSAVKKQKSFIPEEYYDLLLSLDLVSLYFLIGEKPAYKIVVSDIYPVLTGNSKILADDALNILAECQKGA